MDRWDRWLRHAAVIAAVAACASGASAPARAATDPLANMPVPVTDAGVAALDGRIYAVGGFTGETVQPTGSVQIYDPGTDEWSSGTPLPNPAQSVAVVGMHGFLYAFGGADAVNGASPHWLTDARRYNPRTGRWRALTPMPGTPEQPLAAVAGGRIVVFTGQETLTYDPARDAWDAGPAVAGAPFQTAVRGADGIIYLFGGTSNLWMSTMRYDPATGVATPRAALFGNLLGGSGVLLPDGRIYLVGGTGFSGTAAVATGDSYIYDPSADAFVRVGAGVGYSYGGLVRLGTEIYGIGGENVYPPAVSGRVRRLDLTDHVAPHIDAPSVTLDWLDQDTIWVRRGAVPATVSAGMTWDASDPCVPDNGDTACTAEFQASAGTPLWTYGYFTARTGTSIHAGDQEWQARAFDQAGNASEWSPAPPIHVAWLDDRSSELRYHGDWHVVADFQATRGHLRGTNEKGARLTYTFTGHSLMVFGDCTAGGDAQIFVNGRHVGTTERSERYIRERCPLAVLSWAQDRERTVKLVVGGGRFAVDGVVAVSDAP